MYFYDVRFLSSSDDVQVKHTDLKAYKYECKKSEEESALAAGKRSYCEQRGQAWVLSGKRPARLRNALRELEERLRDDRVLLSHWRGPSLLCLIFSTGLVSYIAIHPHTSEITRIFFDRYCVGKIPTGATGAIFTDTHLLFTFAENFTIFVSFNAPATRAGLEKINSREPKYQTIELYGPTRKSEKRVSVRSATTGEAQLLVWSSSAAGELFPWSPAARGEERANVHVYTLNKSQMSLLCYHRIENEALAVELSQLHANIVYSVEQKNYQKGGLSIQCSSYWTERGGAGGDVEGLRARTCGVLAVPAPARAVCRSPCETRLLVACIDATVLVYHEAHGVTRTVKAAFIPSAVRWAAGLVLACEERGRLQCFDLALAPLPATAAHDDAKFIDIGAHLKRQSTVQELVWNSERACADTAPQLLLAFEGGPLALLNLTLTDSVRRWLAEGQVSRVTALLHSLSWDTEGDSCLHILHTTVNHLFRKPLNPTSELLLQEALGTFHQPARPLSELALAEYAAPVHDLTRKFFHHLVRYRRLDKALSLAVDLGDADLFVDVSHAARRAGHDELAREAQQHALDAVAAAGSDCSSCSMSPCSQCSSDCGSDCGSLSDEQSPPHHAREKGKLQVQRTAPPLPYIPKPVLSSLAPPLPIPIVPQEPAPPVHSIRPNIHQYLDREASLWQQVKEYDPMIYSASFEKKPTHKVVDIIPRPTDESAISMHYNSIYQAELREETNGNSSWNKLPIGLDKKPYRSVYGHKSAMASRYPQSNTASAMALSLEKNLSSAKVNSAAEPRAGASRAPGEKNKVKFSDTVTVAVVPEIPRKEKIVGNISLESGARVTDPRKELADSLPLCHPNHDYLRDFAPVPSGNESPVLHDYIETMTLMRLKEK